MNRPLFLEHMQDELEYAECHFPPMASLHEAYAIILEEVDELWEEARKKAAERVPQDVYKELLQIATMAWRAVRDLKLGE